MTNAQMGKLVWKNLETGELTEGAVPFVPATLAVWAIDEDGVLRELVPTSQTQSYTTRDWEAVWFRAYVALIIGAVLWLAYHLLFG